MADNPTQRLFGASMMAVGGLVFGLCGLCTLGFTAMSLVQVAQFPQGFGYLLPALALYGAVGGLPAFLGFLVMRAGYRRMKPAPRRVDPKTFD